MPAVIAAHHARPCASGTRAVRRIPGAVQAAPTRSAATGGAQSEPGTVAAYGVASGTRVKTLDIGSALASSMPSGSMPRMASIVRSTLSVV